ncbi:MAG: TRAP transporter small permease [Candidatus Zhuqueibacterota bacterium]
MKYIQILNRSLAFIEKSFLIFILTSMIILAFVQVLLRNFFSTSLLWGDTLLRHLVLWVGFLGASLAAKENKHISIDVLSRLLPAMWKRVVGVAVNFSSAVVCYFLMRAAMTFVQFEKQGGATLIPHVPIWFFQSIIIIGFGLLMFRFGINAVETMVSAGKSAGEARS